jgi:hypothetical protein
VDALWESRPVGIFRDEPCIVLDDLGDRLHIAYLGADAARAKALGYWQVDRGVFELLTPREDVTGLTEERVDKPLLSSQPLTMNLESTYPYSSAPLPPPVAPPPLAPPSLAPPPPAQSPLTSSPLTSSPLGPSHVAPSALDGPLSDTGGRAARRQRVTTREIFSDLADLAAIPRTAYALETEANGALCLVPTPDGFEVFVAMDGARHEARSFSDEEAAYFYLFGVLAAEAIRNGTLIPAVAPAGARHHLS